MYLLQKSKYKLLVILCLAGCLTHWQGRLYAQQKMTRDGFEQLYSYWAKALEATRVKLGVENEEYYLFQRFSEKHLDSLRGSFIIGISKGTIDPTNVEERMTDVEIPIEKLYRQYQAIKKEYPSSVDEFRRPRINQFQSACDSSGCTNIGFEQGNLSGWNAYYGFNNNENGNFSSFNITNITGGPAGPVTQAADDTLTSTPGFYAGFAGVNPNPRPDYQINITSGLRGDALVPSIPVVSPYGGKYSVMVGDSTWPNYGVAILAKTFYVTQQDGDLTYQYAVFLENPVAHSYYQQPFFSVAVLDQNGDTIPFCGQYEIVSSNGGGSGFSRVYYPPDTSTGLGGDSIYYRDWTIVSVPLKHYLGQCVTIIFETGDCARGGHFSYAYVDAACAPLAIISSSPVICGQKFITLTGPPGFVKYVWSSNTGLNMQADTTQTIPINTAGTYTLIVTPFTGAACADTLSITVTKAVGVVPVPSFTADTTCTGQATNFINTSNPLGGPGVTFYWDFYSLGTFQDSVTNPVWSFNGPGTYFVKLYEVENGCGADTSMKIIVMPPPEAAITGPTTDCHGMPITLTATGGGEYKWNTGATTSSITFVPTPADTSFFVRVTKGCSDTAFFNGIKVYPLKQVTACCDTTIPYGDTAALIASNNQMSYMWSPSTFCDTCRITAASPTQNTTFTVMATDSNGCKSADTVQILIETCGTAWIPNAFTPNHDGLNDVFAPKGQCILTYTMYVFNRWGTLIFKGDNCGWDGTVNGRMVQEDTYVYELMVTTNDKIKRNYIGRVTVIR